MWETSMAERIGAPIAASLMPKVSRISACPSAVAPPWLPMAGMMKGWACRSFTMSTSSFTITARLAICRLPTAITTRLPGLMVP